MSERHRHLALATRTIANSLQQLSSHAVLLHGVPGIGQFEFALGLARAWLCETREADAAHAPACGECVSCRLIEAGSHPDLQVILPRPFKPS